MNIPKTLRPFDGAEIQIRCCQESKCNAPKQYRWNQMLAKMDDPRRESIANSSWQQERKNPIDNRMQEQDMGEEIQLGEVEEEVKAPKICSLKVTQVTQPTVTIVMVPSWVFPLLSPAARLRVAPPAHPSQKPLRNAKQSLEGVQTAAHAIRS